MVEEKKHKCYFDMKSTLKPCFAMTLMLKNYSQIECPELFNFKTGKSRQGYVALKPIKYKKIKGLAFNVCPFCAEKIMNNKEQLNTDKVPYYD